MSSCSTSNSTPANGLGKAGKDDPSTWAFATHVGDLNEWPLAGSALALWGVNYRMKCSPCVYILIPYFCLSVSLSLSDFQID